MFLLYYGDHNVFVALWGLLFCCCSIGIIMFLLCFRDCYAFAVL